MRLTAQQPNRTNKCIVHSHVAIDNVALGVDGVLRAYRTTILPVHTPARSVDDRVRVVSKVKRVMAKSGLAMPKTVAEVEATVNKSSGRRHGVQSPQGIATELAAHV